MTAWQALLAASRLAAGTAWQLITNPRDGVGGGIVIGFIIESDVLAPTPAADVVADALYSTALGGVVDAVVSVPNQVAELVIVLAEAEVVP